MNQSITHNAEEARTCPGKAPARSESELRATLANFATGIAVITTTCPRGDPYGVTVNSFNAVSMSPPLILWSLALKAWSLPVFDQAERFAVNILADHQHDICRLFSSQVEDRFSRISWKRSPLGLPLIDGVIATLQCETWARYPGGDHRILVGHVQDCAHGQGRPLVYAQGRLGGLKIA